MYARAACTPISRVMYYVSLVNTTDIFILYSLHSKIPCRLPFCFPSTSKTKELKNYYFCKSKEKEEKKIDAYKPAWLT